MTTPTRLSHYEVLGVDPDAGERELKAAYRRRVKQLHPDSGGSEHDFEALQAAWRVLADPELRSEYDSWLHDTRPVAGGAMLGIQQRFEQREREIERRAWEARRDEARRRAAEQAAAREAAELARSSEQRANINIHRLLTLSSAALVILVSLLELLPGGAASGGQVDFLGASFQLSPTPTEVSVVQIVLAALVVAVSLVSRPPDPDARGTFARIVSSTVLRTVLGVVAAALAIWVVVPFVLLAMSNAALVIVAGALLVGALLAARD